MISGWGRSAGAVIPALGSGRYSPGPHIVLPSWRKGSALNFTTNVVWGQPGALATVSTYADGNLDFSGLKKRSRGGSAFDQSGTPPLLPPYYSGPSRDHRRHGET